MSGESVRVLAVTFIMDVAWGLGSIYLALEIYEELGLSGYFAAMSVNSLAGFIGALVSGITADFLNLRRSFIVSMISAISLSLTCCALSGANLLLTSFLLGLLQSYEPIAVTRLEEELEQGEASGTYYTASRMGFSVGTFLGGILLDSLSLKDLLILSSLLSLLAAPAIPGGTEERGRVRTPWGGIVRTLAPVMLIEGLVIPLTYSLLEIKLYDSLGRSASLIGSLYSISILLEIAASPLIGKLVDEIGGLRSFLCSSLIYSISLVACISLRDPISMVLLLMLPISPLYFSARNKLAVELTGGSSVLTLSIPTSMGSLSDALFYGALSLLT
ncbi:MAG: MFS transporter [Candidatus Korarchaeum sp.]